MNLENSFFIIGILTLIHILFCISYSKDIYYWVPALKNKILMLLALWLIPIIGVVFIYRHKKFSHMRSYKEGNTENDNAISSGMLEIDSVFNPGARHFIEAIKEQKTTSQEQTKRNKNAGLSDFENLSSDNNNKDTT